jgi:replication initiation protein RepC
LLQEKKLHDDAWLAAKRDISKHRRQLKACMAELEEQGAHLQAHLQSYQKIAMPVRTYMSLAQLRELLSRHIKLLAAIHAELENKQNKSINDSNDSKMSQKSSRKDEPEFVKIHTSTHKLFNKLTNEPTEKPATIFCKWFSGVGEAVPKPALKPLKQNSAPSGEQLILKTGLQHITLRQVLAICPKAIAEQLPLSENISWADLVEAAFRHRGQLYISQHSWAQACQLLGRNGAAICTILTERATQREHSPVTKPGLYFNAMIERAKRGELDLQKAI